VPLSLLVGTAFRACVPNRTGVNDDDRRDGDSLRVGWFDALDVDPGEDRDVHARVISARDDIAANAPS